MLSTITSKVDTENIKSIKAIETKIHTDSNGNANSKQISMTNNSSIRKMASKHSLRNNLRSSINYWQDNNGWLISQKEIPKHSISPPIFNLQASRSTPTHTLKQKGSHQRKVPQSTTLDSEPRLKTQRSSEESTLRTHKYLFRRSDSPKNSNDSAIHTSNRSSVCSVNSMASSVDLIIEQPSMVLPSLKKKSEEAASKVKKAAFRLSTSSLHAIQRSSSMSNIEAIVSQDDQDSEPDEQLCTPPQIYPPQMIINRPVVSPGAGGLGSIRRKAVHRLSIDSFTLGRNKEKVSLSPSVVSDAYDFFLKSQADDNNVSQQQQHEFNTENEINSKQLHEPHTVKHNYLKLLFTLEKSMIEGAYITARLYVPKNLWYDR